METVRKPFQGVINIVRFNWHFYVIALLAILFLMSTGLLLSENYRLITILAAVMVFVTTALSLLVSLYIYDLSGLYSLNWMKALKVEEGKTMINIHAGFDETSELLQRKFKTDLQVFDFYDPSKHTEVSIKRARKAYPTFPGTQSIQTTEIPLKSDSADIVFNIFAAHEIRNKKERVIFFKEIYRILKNDGRVVVTEHLRDTANFLVYSIGFLHFHSTASWLSTFSAAGFKVKTKVKVTPFVTTFILEKNGVTS